MNSMFIAYANQVRQKITKNPNDIFKASQVYCFESLTNNDIFRIKVINGCRTIAPKENCSPIPNLILTQTLTLKLTLTFTENPTLTGGQFSLRGNCSDTVINTHAHLARLLISYYDNLHTI